MKRVRTGRSRCTGFSYKFVTSPLAGLLFPALAPLPLRAAAAASLSPPPQELPGPRASPRWYTDLILILVLQNDIDLLNPPAELEKLKHKKKRLVQSPNSFFMDVKCQGCFNITTVFSHSQTVVVCPGCQTVLCQPTGGKARLTEGCSFRRKAD
ncbi:hypothetical protein ABZP36_004353 [Zizania latifolia]